MIRGPVLLGSDRELLADVRRQFHVAQGYGEFEATRTEPTGAEWIVWSDEGFALVTFAGPGLAAVDLIYVKPEHRRQGHGAALLTAAVAAAREQRAGAILLGLTNDNAAMRSLTATLGFVEAGVIVQRTL